PLPAGTGDFDRELGKRGRHGCQHCKGRNQQSHPGDYIQMTPLSPGEISLRRAYDPLEGQEFPSRPAVTSDYKSVPRAELQLELAVEESLVGGLGQRRGFQDRALDRLVVRS